MNDRILKALRREPVDRTPVWFMRQAGRSLPAYRERRDDRGMFELLHDPKAAAEITAMPLDYYPVDACVLYNDIATPFFGAGLKVTLEKGVGPVVDRPVVDPSDVGRLKPFDPRTELGFTLEAIRLLVDSIDVPVLGFVAAPVTLCSYLVRTPRSRDLRELKTFIRTEPEAWGELAAFWAEHLAEYAIAQHEAGAGAIQVFDSWAGSFSVSEYRSAVLPYNALLLRRLADAGVPTINFYTGNPALLESVAEAGGDGISIDWRVPLDRAWSRVGYDRAIQGNLDPTALLAGADFACREAEGILRRAGGRPGHIFNLGHGILPETDHRVLRAVLDHVQNFDPSSAER